MSPSREAVMNQPHYGEKQTIGGRRGWQPPPCGGIPDPGTTRRGFPGDTITIYEGMHILGAACDGIGDPEHSFVCRSGHVCSA